DCLEAEPQVRDAEQVARPGRVEHGRGRAGRDEDDRRRHDLRRADGEVEPRRRARGHEGGGGEAVDQQDHADEQEADVAHRGDARSMNWAEEMTGAKKLLIRSKVERSVEGWFVPVASPMTIGR